MPCAATLALSRPSARGMRCARSDLKGGRRVARLTTLAAGAEGLRPLAETAGRGVVAEKKKKGAGERVGELRGSQRWR
jgi:hypothetical protein